MNTTQVLPAACSGGAFRAPVTGAFKELSFPPWIGREVTDDPAFSKGELLVKRGGRRFVTSQPGADHSRNIKA
jgi:hypothetical protein